MIKKILVVGWRSLPQELRSSLVNNWNFSNEGFMRVYSEWSPDWSALSMDSIKDYHADQTNNGMFEGTLEEFIVEYGLEIEVFLINSHANELAERPDHVVIDMGS